VFDDVKVLCSVGKNGFDVPHMLQYKAKPSQAD